MNQERRQTLKEPKHGAGRRRRRWWVAEAVGDRGKLEREGDGWSEKAKIKMESF